MPTTYRFRELHWRRRLDPCERALIRRNTTLVFLETGRVALVQLGPLGRDSIAADLVRLVLGRAGVPFVELFRRARCAR